MGQHEGLPPQRVPIELLAPPRLRDTATESLCMQTGIDKLIRILEDEPNNCFTAEEYMTLYTTTYNMCTQKAPHEYSEELYNRYKRVFEDYLTETVRCDRPISREDHAPVPLSTNQQMRDKQSGSKSNLCRCLLASGAKIRGCGC
jgi:hypothetical protein